jgi:hypothetical protein
MTEAPRGIVVAVCMSAELGYPTYPQDRVVIGPQGIDVTRIPAQCAKALQNQEH